MAETLREFLVSFGFAAQDSTRAEAAVAAAEKRVTAGNAAELRARETAGTEAQKRLLSMQDKVHTDTRRKNTEIDRYESDRRVSAFKQTEQFAIRMGVLSTKIVASVNGAAGGIFWATERAARSLERLNYMSQRTGASPGGVSAFAYAASQTGGSVEGANESLEKFGDNLKRFPQAYEGALKNLGVQTRDVKGNLRETSALATDLVQKLSALPRAQRSVQGGFFGINEETIQAGARPEFRQRYNEREEINRRVGFDPDKAAAGGTAFEQSMRRLDAVLGAIKDKVTSGLFDKLQPDIEKLSTWAENNGPHVAEIFGRIAADLLKLANAILDKIVSIDWDNVITKVENFAKEFDRLSKQYFGADGITVVFDAFGALLAVSVLARLTAIIGAMRTLAGLTPAPWLMRLIGAPAVAGTAVVGSLLASGDPTKSALAGGTPDVKAQDNDLGLPGTDAGTGDRTRSSVKSSGVWGWLQSKLGFGGDDQRVKDAIVQTAESTKKLVENATAASGGGASVNTGGGAKLGSGAPNIRYGRQSSTGSGAYRGTPVPDAPYNGKNIDGLSESETKQYASVLGQRESGNRYGITNPYGYVGRWQMGADALAENGYVKKGTTNAGLNNPSNWTGKGGVSSVEEFKANKGSVQDTEFGEYTNRHYAQLKKAGVINDGMSAADKAGWLAAAHLKGVGGAIALSRGHDNSDANGTSASSYKRMMSGVGAGPRAQAPVPTGTSSKAVSDAEVFAARQRLAAGGSNPADRALVSNYADQQAHPSTLGDARDKLRAAMGAGAGGGTVPKMAIDEDSIRKLGNHIREKTNAQPLSDSKHQSMNSSSKVMHLTNAPTFHLSGGHHDTMLASAHKSSSRGQQDLLRNVQSAEV